MTPGTRALEQTPVIVATGQSIERDAFVGALDLAERAARVALDEPGRSELRNLIDRVSVVNISSPVGPAPARLLASRLGLGPTATEVSTVGGNSPQWLVAKAAQAVFRGEARAVLVAGGEAQRSAAERRAALKSGGSRRSSSGQGGKPFSPDASPALTDLVPGRPHHEPVLVADEVVGDDRPGFGPAEMNSGLLVPAHIYPLFESVLASRAGRTPEQQRRWLGDVMAPFTEVAASNPWAWFPYAQSPQDLAEPGPSNRMVAEPYPKRMCAMIRVDQGAAVVVTTLGEARRAGLDDGAVFCWSAASAHDVWFPTARPDLASSPGIKAAAKAALDAAGIGVDDLSRLDIYSCFPSAVQVAAAAIGIELDDPRRLTVTGGLPYFGGPVSNYSLHAIAAMVDLLRAQEGMGLVTALGWYITKHAVGVYGSAPPPRGWQMGDTSAAQAMIDATAVPMATGIEGASEPATILGATVTYGPGGEPDGAPVIARLSDGRQVAARLAPSELNAAPALSKRDLVGEKVVVQGSPPLWYPS